MSLDNIHQATQLINDAHHQFVILADNQGKHVIDVHHVCDLKTLKAFKKAFKELCREQKKRLKAGGGHPGE